MSDNARQRLAAAAAARESIAREVSKRVFGQDEVVDLLLVALFSRAHTLMMGVPGLGKTLLVSTLSQALGLSFNRIQFTPDLMPSDITGSEILDESRHFRFNKGPLFANIVLADEINRTPPKTQAALLEAMQERVVTVSGQRHLLPKPFFVLATQNPIEQEGTYPLPEAQLDRFMFNIPLDYPSYEEEIKVVKETTVIQNYSLKSIMDAEEILFFQNLIRKIPVPDNVLEYAVKMATRTRPQTKMASEKVNNYLAWGAGPRASQYLVLGAKCHAAIRGKYAPDMDDVRAIAKYVLRHRIVRNYKAEAEGVTEEMLIQDLF